MFDQASDFSVSIGSAVDRRTKVTRMEKVDRLVLDATRAERARGKHVVLFHLPMPRLAFSVQLSILFRSANELAKVSEHLL